MTLLPISALDDWEHEAEHAVLERAHHSFRASAEEHAEDEQQTCTPEAKDARNIGNAHTLQILQDEQLRFVGSQSRSCGHRVLGKSIDDAKSGPEQGEREDENNDSLEEFETQVEIGLEEVDKRVFVDWFLAAERADSTNAFVERMERPDDGGLPASCGETIGEEFPHRLSPLAVQCVSIRHAENDSHRLLRPANFPGSDKSGPEPGDKENGGKHSRNGERQRIAEGGEGKGW